MGKKGVNQKKSRRNELLVVWEASFEVGAWGVAVVPVRVEEGDLCSCAAYL